ncbi:MAG: transporter [Betaproteobacteria bacterium]
MAARNNALSRVLMSLCVALSVVSASALAQPSKPSSADLAAKLTNPVADLISVPFQYNYDQGIGADKKGTANSLVVQPVVPIKLNNNWNYIVRPVVTFESLNNVNGFSGNGTAPVLLETFFSPRAASDFIWGVGPILSTPALTSGGAFGTAQTGAGVAAVGLVMKAPWTIGLLTYNTWGVGGSTTYGTANNLFYQPFASYVTKDAWTFTVNTQSTFNWDMRRAENPMNATVSKIVHFGEAPVSLSVGARYYLSSMPGGPTGWGARASMTFLFPR